MKTRRDFIKRGGMAAAAIAAAGAFSPAEAMGGLVRSTTVEMPPDDIARALMHDTITARMIPYTGLTRDGTFLIENGKIKAHDFNFTSLSDAV